jgi:hypothetical protein
MTERLDAKRTALDALASRVKTEGYGTTDGTNAKTGSPAGGQVKQWWTWGGSNPRPPRCERGALPTELHAQEMKT